MVIVFRRKILHYLEGRVPRQRFDSSHRTTHVEAMSCYATIPFWTYPFQLDISEISLLNHSRYSSSLGKFIHMSAKNLDNQKVGYTGPMIHALPPIFSTLYASLMPRCGSGQYSILKNIII